LPQVVEQTGAGQHAFDAVYMGAEAAASSAPEDVDGVADVAHNTHIHPSTAELGRTSHNRTDRAVEEEASLAEAHS
jgi:hypothetical protein